MMHVAAGILPTEGGMGVAGGFRGLEANLVRRTFCIEVPRREPEG